MRQSPLLILAYNRPDKMRGLIEALRALRPMTIMVVVDGPKHGNAADAVRVQAVRDAVGAIDWTDDLHTRFRPVNIGLRRSVVDAVSWATSEYGQVIVIEEDVIPGPAFIPYAEHMLERYRDDERISHISGYNVVPGFALDHPEAPNRLTVYPESIAWATWDRAWRAYDDELSWGPRTRIASLRAVVGSLPAALRWKQNFRDANAGRISTWAYRWIASMWSGGRVVLSPNHNLVTYVGQDEGTHTTTAPPWKELPLYSGPFEALIAGDAQFDARAEAWVNRVVFRGTPFGVARGVAITLVLAVRLWKRSRRS